MNVLNVIFVEDDKFDFEIYEEVFSSKFPNIKVHNIYHDDQDYFKRFDPKTTIVFLDLKLNHVDGVDYYVKNVQGSGLITFVHTSSDNPSDIEKCKHFSVGGYFQKKQGIDEIYKQFKKIFDYVNSDLLLSV